MRAVALSSIRSAMADQERSRFTLRLTPELEAAVNQSQRKHRRSKNAEILAALDWRYRPDRALDLAQALRPLLDALSEKQMAALLDIVETMAKGAKRKKKRPDRDG